jgi:NADPH:quinone reductase-like Zn-dependent oxidoreductase
MKSVHIRAPGGPEVLSLVERVVPSPGPGEVLIRVAAAAVNRPDVQQRRGLYPPPPGVSVVLGLDVAGVIDRVAPDVDWPRPGEAVCALANGGGYAEFCSVPAVQCMPIPKGFDFVEAAALPEAFFTAWNSMVWLGRLDHGETVLVQRHQASAWPQSRSRATCATRACWRPPAPRRSAGSAWKPGPRRPSTTGPRIGERRCDG